ncbi:hypothetical protein GCM10009557_84080 [Virgisporangium ochraceum]
MRRNRGLQVLLLAVVAVGLLTQFTDWPPWAVIVGGVSLAVGALVLVPGRAGHAAEVTVGRVPALAPAFQPRTGVQAEMTKAREAGNDVVLHGTGGTGTTQLAAAVAHEATGSGADLVVWVDAAAPASVVTAFARAGYQVDAPGVTGTDVSVDARALVAWLEETDRRWLVVFDGVTDLASLDGWRPGNRTESGWVVATTTAPVTGAQPERWTRVEVGPFTAAEAHEYLTDCKLVDDDAADLVAELGHLPLALHRAVSYLRAERVACGDYLQRWIDRRKTVVDPAEAAVLLAVDAAHRYRPTGRTLPALRMAAVLDPAGQPVAVWANAALVGFLTGGEPGNAATGIRAATVLHRYGLVDHDRRLGAWAVRMHPDTAHAVRKNLPADVRDDAARAAADAVLDTWPDHVQVLRANAVFLARLDGDPLWRPEPHELLWRAGIALERAGLSAAAIEYWQHLVDTGERLHGPRHRATLIAVGRLAASQGDAGDTTAAVATHERVVAGLAELDGPGHPQTLDATERLAVAYLADGRGDDAVALLEQVLQVRTATLGPDHADTAATAERLAEWTRDR